MKKKISFKISFYVSCIILFLAFLTLSCVASLGIVAYTTNKYIPGITEVVESVEQAFINPNDLAREGQLKMAEEVYSLLEKATTEEGMTYDELEEKYSKLLTSSENSPGKTSMTSSIKIAKDKSADPIFLLNLESDNTSNSDENTSRGELNFEAEFSGIKTDGKFEMASKMSETNQELYFKIVEMPFLELIGETEEYDFDNTWMKLSTADIESLQDELSKQGQIPPYYLNILNFNDPTTKNQKIEISKEELDMIKKLLENEQLIDEVSWEKGKTFNGNRARCISFNWDGDGIKEFLKEYERITEEQVDWPEAEEFLNDLDKFEVYTCSDRQSFNLNELKLNLVYESDEDLLNLPSSKDKKNKTYIEVTIDLVFTEYGKKYDIELPEAEIDLVEIIEKEIDTFLPPDDFQYDPPEGSGGNGGGYYNSEKLYTLYVSKDCSHCVDVKKYLEEEEIITKISLIEYNIENEFDSENFKAICEEKVPDSNCGVPMLVIYDYTSESFSEEVVLGNSDIIKYFEEHY